MSKDEEKTIKQWMEELPEPYRTEALKHENKGWKLRYPTQSQALEAAFTWRITEVKNTSSGPFKYWSELYMNLLTQDK